MDPSYIPPPPDGCKNVALAAVGLVALLLVALVDAGVRGSD